MKVKIAQIQAHVYEEKSKNLEELERNLKRIKDENIDLVTLGEMFNCPYQTPCFPVYAEMEQGETWQRLSALAKKYKIYLSVYRKKIRKDMCTIPLMSLSGRATRLQNTAKCICLISP